MKVEDKKLAGVWMEDSSGKNVSGIQQGKALPQQTIPNEALIPPHLK